MTDIKSINHQNIHSTQPAQAEATQKNSELVKESRPAEFRPLSNEQKESIKLTRNAENKLAESAIMAKTTSQAKSGIAEKAANLAAEAVGKPAEFKTGGAKDLVKTAKPKDLVTNDVPKGAVPYGTGPTISQGEIDKIKAFGKDFDKYTRPLPYDKNPKKIYEDTTGVSLDQNKEVDKLNSDGDTYKFSVGGGQGAVVGHESKMEVEVKQVGTPPDKVYYEMKVAGSKGVAIAGGIPGVSGEAGVSKESSATFRFDNKEDLKEGLKHLQNLQAREASFILESPKAMDERDKAMGVDKSMAFLKEHRASVEYKVKAGEGISVGSEGGIKVGAGVKGEAATGVRVTFPRPPDEPNAKVTVISEKTVSVNVGSGVSVKGVDAGGEVSGEATVTTEKTYELPPGTDLTFLDDPQKARLNALDVAKQKGKLTEQKVQISGKMSVSEKFGAGAEGATGKAPEFGFDLEVNLPPGKELPDDFYERLAKGDVPGALKGIDKGDYNLKAYKTTKYGYDFNPSFSWGPMWGRAKVQHQRLDQENMSTPKQGNMPDLEKDWEEMLREFELK